jgi:hypothetical protein
MSKDDRSDLPLPPEILEAHRLAIKFVKDNSKNAVGRHLLVDAAAWATREFDGKPDGLPPLVEVFRSYRERGEISPQQFQLLGLLLDDTGSPLPPRRKSDLVSRLYARDDGESRNAFNQLKRRTARSLQSLGGEAHFHISKNGFVQLIDGRSATQIRTRS